jgi:glutamate synthase domain-containing protein 1
MDESDQRGLYRASEEHDACGVGFVANIKGARSHQIVRSALDLLINLEHRGACGSDPDTGDGAGILIQMPDRFFRDTLPFDLPPAGSYGAGLVFLPHDADARAACKAIVERIVNEEGQTLLGWRDLPINFAKIGKTAASVAPVFEQVFVGANFSSPEAFELKLYVIRKLI